MIYLAYVAGVVLAVGLLVLAMGLIRGRRGGGAQGTVTQQS